MSEKLPVFKYHPNPIETGNIKLSDEICLCCNQKRGYLYQASIYSETEIRNVTLEVEGKIVRQPKIC